MEAQHAALMAAGLLQPTPAATGTQPASQSTHAQDVGAAALPPVLGALGNKNAAGSRPFGLSMASTVRQHAAPPGPPLGASGLAQTHGLPRAPGFSHAPQPLDELLAELLAVTPPGGGSPTSTASSTPFVWADELKKLGIK